MSKYIVVLLFVFIVLLLSCNTKEPLLYDILGTEMATLVNEEKPAGNYEVEFSASDLSSGIYFYTLSSGSFVQTRKMIVLK